MLLSEPLGRKEALSDVERYLDRLPSGMAAFAITGPAGIGKTTVWREGIRRAELLGYRVLTARPTQAERSLAFAGLTDLLATVEGEVFEQLAPVQRHAIDVALLRTEPDRSLMDRRAIPAAVLSVLGSLATAGPLLLAIDDAQWVDQETVTSLSFALHRLERLPVGVLVSVRVEDDRIPTVESAVAPDRRQEILLGPLSAAALHWIVRQHLGQQLPRPVLVRIVTSCGGNPFYALEIARELGRVGMPSAWEPLPVPAELQTLLRRRMGRLPPRTKEALLFAACLSQPTTGLVDAEAMSPAEEAGIVRIDRDGRIRFNHPLLASAVSDSVSSTRRRAVHRELGERVADPEESARHLGLATPEPDEAVAACLDAAAGRAASRGAMPTALDLVRRAIELTPEPASETSIRRVIAFGDYSVMAGGDPAEARVALESSLALCESGDLRAELLLQLAFVSREAYQMDEGYPLLLSALDETSDPELAARIHLQAIWMAEADPVHGTKHCDAVLELVDETSNPGLYSGAIMHRAYLQLISGHGADDDAIERGCAIEDLAVERGWRSRSPVPVIWPLLKDDFAGAVDAHLACLEWARHVGERALEMSMARHLSTIELWRGNWEQAEEWASSLGEMVEQSGSNRFRDGALFTHGMVEAYRGQLDRAEAAGREALAIGAAVTVACEVVPRHLLGFIAFSRGDLSEAAEHFGRANEIMESLGQREPAQERFHGDYAEALIGLGERDRAASLVASLAARAEIFPRPWLLVMSARCRGLLLSAAGDLEGATEAMQEALAHHDRLNMPFELGRTLLCYGQLLRRQKKRREARITLADALEIFEKLGSPIWADRSRDELKRVPVRSAPFELSATEEEIAQLAAAGLTTRQIAERSFLSRKTVAGNLERVYLKLGVHSRAELGRVMAERSQASDDYTSR